METFKSPLREQIDSSIEVIRKYTDAAPTIGIILGTGLGNLVNEIEVETEIPYDEIPNFHASTVESHHGKLIFGRLSGKSIVAMQGRFHYYEGFSMQEITFPVRVMKFLGIKTLILSNACGSVNPYIPKSSIMIIDDHINLFGDNPLIGKHDPAMGPRFVDMSEPYTRRLIALAEEVAVENKVKMYKGVYAAMSGPSLETRAEYRFIRNIGADVIGMSTIPECIVARQMGLETLGISIITDECYPDALKPVSINEIIEAAAIAEPNMSLVIKETVRRI